MMKPTFAVLTILAGLSFFPPVTSHAQSKNVAKPILVTGIVAGAPRGREFLMRANRQTYRVRVLPEVNMTSIKGGDRVRVWGIPTRQNLQRANVRVLATGASNNPDDYTVGR